MLNVLKFNVVSRKKYGGVFIAFERISGQAILAKVFSQ